MGQHFLSMAFGLDLLEDVLNLSVGADHECGPGDAHHFSPIHVLLAQDAEGDGDLLVGIGQQREGKIVLLRKFFLRTGRVGRDAKQRGAGFLNLFICVAEPASFDGSTGRVGPRVKEQDDRFAAQVLQRKVFSVLIL